MKVERRVISGSGSLRAASEGKQKIISGYAAVFNSLSEPIGGNWRGNFTEKIDPHAFDKSLASATFDCRCMFNHDCNQILGRTKSKTLSVAVDNIGVQYTCVLPDTRLANDLFASIQRSDISGSSFGFETVEDSWNDSSNTRTLLEVTLLDLGPVTFPAYPATSASVDVRGLAGKIERVPVGVYAARSLHLPSLTDAERRAKAKALARELRGEADDDEECSCQCDPCQAADDCENCDCDEGCEGENCANGSCECASARAARSLHQQQGRTLYPEHLGGLDPIAAREQQELEKQLQFSRWLVARPVQRH